MSNQNHGIDHQKGGTSGADKTDDAKQSDQQSQSGGSRQGERREQQGGSSGSHGQQSQGGSEKQSGSKSGGSGNFADDPQRASEAGKKGGEHSHGGSSKK